MSYAEEHNLRPGDELISSIFKTGLPQHHAVYLGPDDYGIDVISENDAKEGVRLVTARDYFSRVKKFKVKAFEGTDQEREAAVARAFSQLGRPYHLMRHNCEHHTSFVRTGVTACKQVAVMVGVLTFLFITWLITADTNKKYLYGKL